jgi:thiol-disulfide isomerase/thioredoxin
MRVFVFCMMVSFPVHLSWAAEPALNFKAEVESAKMNVAHNPDKGLFEKGPKGSLIVYFASWCGFCRGEMPQVNQIYERASQCGVNVIGVAVEKEQEATAKAVKDWKIRFPVIQDLDGRLKKFASVRKIPALYLLDENGAVVESQVTTAGIQSFYSKVNDRLKAAGCKL